MVIRNSARMIYKCLEKKKTCTHARTSQKTSFSRLMTASGSDAGASSWKRDSSTNRTDASCIRETGEWGGQPSDFSDASKKKKA